MYPIRPSFFFRILYPGALWRVNTKKKRLFLTFDDGPDPEVTPWVLDQLQKHGSSATFFMLGKNAEKYPQLVSRVREGHRIGNHGYEHLDGYKTSSDVYLENAQHGSMFTGTKLFRAPYGRIRPKQYRVLNRTYRMAFWDLLPGDWDQSIDTETVWNRIEKKARNGSIITLHDSQKAFPHLKIILPRLLEHFSAQGYKFPRLPRRQ